MTETAEQLRSALAGLSTRDRAELAHFLIGSLDDGIDSDAEGEWEAELVRRFEQIEQGTAGGEPADKVIAELRAKFK